MVVAVGGDGTVNRVINAVGTKNIPVGILPRGSSNDLADALGIPRDFRQACQVIKAARMADIDLISVNGTCFATCGGIGLAADVSARANQWRKGRSRISSLARALGRKVYPLAVLRELLGGWRPPEARIVSQEGCWQIAWFSVLISNQPNFGGFSASPAACNRDGFADICQMESPGRRGRMFWISLQTLRGRADNCREVSQRRAQEATIVARDPVPFFGDGEILEQGRFFRIQVQPRALWVVVPDGAKTWEWWKRIREQNMNLVRLSLRRERCQPMIMSA
jgi:diacylglycerol kinase (ATP)